jgi:flagellin-like protein
MRAISPVIATVVIVAVTLAVAIAVSLWATGLVGGFTGTENLQIVNAYATPSGGGWTVTLQVKNAGTTTATIDNVFVNGIPYNQISIGNSTIALSVALPLSLSPGNNTVIALSIPQGSGAVMSFSSGQQVEIKLHSASGKTYPVQVVLP